MFPFPLTSEKAADIEWVRSWKDDEVDFWGYVDSTPNVTAAYWRCYCDDPERECSIWAHRRDGEWCLAGNSRGERCSKLSVQAAPFCSFHLDRAWAWMLAVGDENMIARFETRMRRREAEERAAALLAEMQVEQIEDMRIVAERLAEQVYFFLAGDAVKIGRSIDPAKRVKTLSGTKAPDGVDVRSGVLLGTVPGGCRVESWLHRTFAYCRLAGEWFDYTEISDDIAAILEAGAVEIGGAA